MASTGHPRHSRRHAAAAAVDSNDMVQQRGVGAGRPPTAAPACCATAVPPPELQWHASTPSDAAQHALLVCLHNSETEKHTAVLLLRCPIRRQQECCPLDTVTPNADTWRALLAQGGNAAVLDVARSRCGLRGSDWKPLAWVYSASTGAWILH